MAIDFRPKPKTTEEDMETALEMLALQKSKQDPFVFADDKISGLLHSMRRLYHHYRHEADMPQVADDFHRCIVDLEIIQLKIFPVEAT